MSRAEFPSKVRKAAWDYFADKLRYEPETGNLYWLPRPRDQFNTDKGWKCFNTRDAGKPTKCGLTMGYKTVRIMGSLYLAHRICWVLANKREIPSGMLVDHKNGDKTDNRASNLRLATIAQNGHNQKPKAYRDLPKGVHWDKARKQFVAYVAKDRVSHFVGRFDSVRDAADAVTAARSTLHGEFARHV